MSAGSRPAEPSHPELPSLTDRATGGLVVYAVFFAIYVPLNRLIPVERCWDLTGPLDRAIPFVPAFVFPFYLTYALVLAPVFGARTRVELRLAALAFVALILCAGLAFLLVPVTVPRPAEIPDGLAGRLVSLMYAADRPVCGFPSLHVAASILAVAILLRQRRRWGILLAPAALLAAVSTLFVKQHVIADFAGGVALALVVAAVTLRRATPREALPRSSARALRR